MDPDAAPLLDRILHARAEVLLRAALREGWSAVAAGVRTPLVVVGHDRSGTTRWLEGGDAGLLAAVTAEFDPVAVGCLLVVRAAPEHVVGTAVTVSFAGARALALDARRRRFGRPRVTFGRQEDPQGVAGEVALALLEAVERATRSRGAA